MRYVNRLPLFSLAMIGLATPALAQDDPLYFNGPYVGASVGLSMPTKNRNDAIAFDTNRDGTFADTVNTSGGTDAFAPGFCDGRTVVSTPASCTGDFAGGEYAVKLGYDARLGGSFVVGAVAELSRADITDSSSAFSITPASYSFSRKLDHAMSLRGRVGWVPTPKMMVYATGGGSYARIDHTFTTTNVANSFTQVDPEDRVWGYQVGGGAEYMIGRNVSFGLEYLYNRYNDDKYFVAVGPGSALPTNPFLLVSGGTNMRQANTDFDFHAIRASMNFRF